MRNLAFLLLLASTLTGCETLQKRTGEFVSEAVVDHIAEKVDQRLGQRGLSLAEIKSAVDTNEDGSVSLGELKETASIAAREVATSTVTGWEAQKRAEWNQATKNLVTRDEQDGIKGDVRDFWLWLKATIGALIATVLSYLTKQVFSAKSDGRRDAEIAKAHARTDMLEKLLNRDLNQDGTIGGTPVT